jgi:hypothetical protein
LQILAIGAGEPKQVASFAARYAPSIQCACSVNSEAHAAYGLQRHTIAALFQRQVIVSHLRSAQAGYTPGQLSGDVRILPGTFIVDTQGIIRYAFYSRYVGDEPLVDDLLHAFSS